jgi:hypothetical protein
LTNIAEWDANFKIFAPIDNLWICCKLGGDTRSLEENPLLTTKAQREIREKVKFSDTLVSSAPEAHEPLAQ